jgi:hypothetical protein
VVDRGWGNGVGRDLDEHLAQLVEREAEVARGVQVHVELRFAAAVGGEHGQPWRAHSRAARGWAGCRRRRRRIRRCSGRGPRASRPRPHRPTGRLRRACCGRGRSGQWRVCWCSRLFQVLVVGDLVGDGFEIALRLSNPLDDLVAVRRKQRGAPPRGAVAAAAQLDEALHVADRHAGRPQALKKRQPCRVRRRRSAAGRRARGSQGPAGRSARKSRRCAPTAPPSPPSVSLNSWSATA